MLGAGGGNGGAMSAPTATAPGANVVPIMPVSIDECTPAKDLDPAAVQALMKGGAASGVRWLYPYDGTVFPRGLMPPLLMWDGPASDAVYVHIHSSLFDYKGCFKPTGPNQLQLADSVWAQATDRTGGASDPFQIELTTSSGGAVAGPIVEKVVVAKATLKGSIFYNTYSTKLLPATGAPGGSGGAVLRITPGKPAEVFLGASGCTGCHSVSADGTRLTSFDLAHLGGASYALTPGIPADPPPLATVPGASFTGIYPDGSVYVSSANQGGVGPRGAGPTASMYETATGNAVMGSGIPPGAMTPAFSPDGSLVAFTDYAIDTGRGLALMRFDGAKRVASDYRQLYKVSSPNYPAWPFILPDNNGIVYAVGPTADFSGGGVGVFLGLAPLAPASDLFILDVASGAATILAKAMGFASPGDADSNTTYLPFGAAEETHHNYYPTVSPVAAGGYFWVFFDSYRHYGNLGLQRQLWGAAVDVSADGKYTTDPSHPAFYLTGQEFGTGNHRAFTALDPCHKDGDACTTGIDCCSGFCTNGKCGVPPPPPHDAGPRCAQTDESCASGTACCDPTDHCIAGRCGTVIR